ncbi:MAG: FAD-binding oxidoreductase [Acidimicrobiia bacterium]
MSFTLIPNSFDDAVADLRGRTVGEVLTADDAGYDAARAAWNVVVQQRPAVIVVPESVGDVAAAVRFARANGLRVAVQATGHGVARPSDGAVMIVTARLDAVTIDPAARTARVSAGAKWGAVLAPAQEHGLAPLLGSTTDVGAIGYTLGGGMGWLARHYGLASDSVRSFDLVTPDGSQVHASADEQPELFWALKGGGGGTFGVVTAMEIELYPVRTVYAGNLLYPVEMAREVMTRWRDWASTASDELTSSVVIMNFPPLEEVPEPVRGRSFVIVRGCWSGDLAEGEALLDEWRNWRAPALDLFGPMPFSAADGISNDPVDPMPAMVTTEWFDVLADEAIDVLIRATVAAPGHQPTLAFSEIRHAGGAVRANAPKAANDRGRSGEFLLEMVGIAPHPHAGLALEAHLRYTRLALAPFVTGAAYLNFMEGREKQERTPTAYSADHLRRVQAVKAAVDPDDRFCHGFGITPA